MNLRIHLFLVSATVMAGGLSLLHAQVPDGTGALYTNATNVFNNVTIGTNGTFTLLILATNALFSNPGNGTIGLNASARSNEVQLINPTARWFLGNFLYVGSNGSFNRLLVSNGATVRSVNGYLGPSPGANSNLAILTGTASTWTNSNGFYLGFNGAGNQLIVSNGGVLQDNFSNVGVNSGSSNNSAIITGVGSLWNNVLSLQFGNGGPGNQLVISNGGVVRSSAGYFGGGTSASNTMVTVTGTGSLWTNTTDFYVGQGSVGNRLLVNNGGRVQNGHGYVGGVFTGSNNLALITGVGSVWSNALDLNVGSYSGFNQAIASNGATIFVAGNGIIGPTANGDGNVVTVAGMGSRWQIGTDLYLGSNGALSRLIITNGGLVTNRNAIIGQSISSSNNVATVTGAGSTWSNSGPLYFGSVGRSNQLLISDGAKLLDGACPVGLNSSSSNNQVTVTGSGSVWSHAAQFYVGFGSVGNQLVVSNGGFVGNSVGVVGIGLGANSNVAFVTGSGSVWSNTSLLNVGSEGVGNRLIVSDGGAVWDSTGTVGLLAGDNAALVTGAGSRWTNSLDFFVGNSSSRNQLVVSNGATVFAGGNGYVGCYLGANSNSAIVTDAGTRWLLSSNLYVGSNSALNRLVITNGALVANAMGTLGQTVSSTNNLAVVTGAGSTWSNTGKLFAGLNGAGNQLVVSNGGRVVAASGDLGANSTSSNNLAVVTGTGSMWKNSGDLQIGFSGSGNQLVVSNGGWVSDDTGLVGWNSTSNNSVWVTGAGSVWSNASYLRLSDSGSFNQVVVSNGGTVLSLTTYINIGSAGRSNLLVVTGAGSLWSNTYYTSIGNSGSGNRVVVSAGGAAQTGGTTLGYYASGSNNTALVTGAGSTWSNSGSFFVGYTGAVNQLVISNGGTFSAGDGVYLGYFPASTNNRIEISGSSLLVGNAFGTGILDIQRGTNVLNAGLMDVDQLLLTNVLGWFEFNVGTLRTRSTSVNNGRILAVGNGSSAATFQLQDGLHSFANGLSIANNGSLTGDGTVSGTVNVLAGGVLAPGSSIGKITLNNSPILQGATLMEISRNGTVLTNDEIQVGALLVYAGTLTVTNIGPTPLVAGDRFKLFTSGTYLGSFASVALPPLGFNLSWTNKLALDGSIEVVSGPVPQFTSVSRSGTNLVFAGIGGIANASYAVLTATNVTQPLDQWSSITTNQFGAGGSFSFTNGISPGTPRRFFRLRWP